MGISPCHPRRRPLHETVGVAILLASCSTGCPSKAEPPTANGTTLVDWTRGPTSFSTGVSLGADVGPAVVENKTLVFTPEKPRNDALRPVRLSLHLERGDVEIVANAQGERPAEQGSAPRKIHVTVVDNGGFQHTGSCDESVLGPSSLGGRRVGFAQRCNVNLKSGDDTGGIHFTFSGDGKLQTVASFGAVVVQ